MAEEITILKEGNILVTTSRFVVGSQTYAMSGITAVKNTRKDPNHDFTVLLILAGIGIMFFGGQWILWGLVLIGIGAFIAWIKKPEYGLVLSTASGESQAVTSDDENYIDKIVSSLNDAIVQRG